MHFLMIGLKRQYTSSIHYHHTILYSHCLLLTHGFRWDVSGWRVGVVILAKVRTGWCDEVGSHGILYAGLYVNVCKKQVYISSQHNMRTFVSYFSYSIR